MKSSQFGLTDIWIISKWHIPLYIKGVIIYNTLNTNRENPKNEKKLSQLSQIFSKRILGAGPKEWKKFREREFQNCKKLVQNFIRRGESAALGHFLVSVLFGQVDKESKTNIVASQYNSLALFWILFVWVLEKIYMYKVNLKIFCRLA